MALRGMTEEQQIEECKARIDAMRALMADGWEPKRIALALGMRNSWTVAEQWMHRGQVSPKQLEATR